MFMNFPKRRDKSALFMSKLTWWKLQCYHNFIALNEVKDKLQTDL